MLGVTYGAGSTAAAPGAQAKERNPMHLSDLTGLPYMRKLLMDSGVTSLQLALLPSQKPEVCMFSSTGSPSLSVLE